MKIRERWTRVALVTLWLGALGSGCSKKPVPAAEKKPAVNDVDAVEHADEEKHEQMPTRIRLTDKVIADVGIKTAPVAKQPLAPTLLLPGEIVSDPDKTARISTPAAGRIVKVSFREGAVVKKGDVLATLRIADVGKVRSAQNAAAAKGLAARANADRLKDLADKGLGAKQEAVAAQAEAEALEAEARGLGQELGVLGLGTQGTGSEIALRAAVSGTVVSRDAVAGQPVTAEQTLGTIVDLSEAWFLGRVFEKDLGQLSVGSKAEVLLNAYPKQRFEGVVEFVGRQLDPIARTLTARVRLTNRDDLLRIGLFGNARVSVMRETDERPVLVVPETAVTEIGGKSIVFVKHPDGDFELHVVVLGEASLGKIEVVRGLREGEQVVEDGVFALKSSVLKSTLAEED